MAESEFAQLKQRFDYLTERESADHLAVNCPAEKLVELCTALRDDSGYDLLVDVTAVDWDAQSPRFTGIYHLLSTNRHEYLRIAATGGDDDFIQRGDGRILRRRLLGDGGDGQRAPGGPRQKDGLYESVHLKPQSLFPAQDAFIQRSMIFRRVTPFLRICQTATPVRARNSSGAVAGMHAPTRAPDA